MEYDDQYLMNLSFDDLSQKNIKELHDIFCATMGKKIFVLLRDYIRMIVFSKPITNKDNCTYLDFVPPGKYFVVLEYLLATKRYLTILIQNEEYIDGLKDDGCFVGSLQVNVNNNKKVDYMSHLELNEMFDPDIESTKEEIQGFLDRIGITVFVRLNSNVMDSAIRFCKN